MLLFFFKQKTAYEIKECDWSSDVCSSDLFKNKNRGILSSVDVLGEDVKREEDAHAACDLYLRTIEALGNRKHTSISLKPGHMGAYVSREL